MQLTGKQQVMHANGENKRAKADVRMLFSRHIVRSMRALQDRIRSVDVLSREEQERVINFLTLAFERPTGEIWPVCCELVTTAASAMEQAQVWQSWMHVLGKGIEQSQHLEDAVGEAHFSLLLGFQKQRIGEWGSAEKLYRVSLRLFDHQKSVSLYGLTLGRLGFLKYLQGALDEADEYARASLLQLTDNQYERHLGYYVQGLVALAQLQTEKAIEKIKLSLEICDTWRDRRTMAMRYRTLGWAYVEGNDLAKAFRCLDKAMSIFDEVGDISELALARMNLGIAFDVDEQPLRALDLYAEALPLFRQLSDQPNLAKLYNNQGLAYRKLGRMEEAEHVYKSSIELQQRLGDVRLLVGVFKNLGVLYAEMDEQEKAIQTLDSALDALNRLEDQTVVAQLTEEIEHELQQLR